jgi:hypothetical protein
MFSSAWLEMSSTSAHSSASLAGVSYPFSGVTFSPLVAPVISPTMSDDFIALAWPAVTLSSNKPVAYTVTRTSSTGSVATVCNAPAAPVVNGAIASCSDSAVVAGTSYTYTEQPHAFVGVFSTWSRSVSAASTTITPPNWKFGQLGTVVTSTNNGNRTISYPSGVVVGDILLLVTVNNNGAVPTTPSGWTQLVSQSITTPSTFSMSISWRVADAATSVSMRLNANNSGAMAVVLNYGRAFSSTTSPVIAHSASQSSTSNASATFIPPTNVTTNEIAARALSIVAVNTNNALALSDAAGYTVRGSNAQVIATGAISLAIADTVVETSGTTPTSPTWSQSGTPAQWISGLVAFA